MNRKERIDILADSIQGLLQDRIAPDKCPHCKGSNIVPFLYGLPTDEARAKAQRGEVKLGGCTMINDHEWYCKDCNSTWKNDDVVTRKLDDMMSELEALERQEYLESDQYKMDQEEKLKMEEEARRKREYWSKTLEPKKDKPNG